MSQKKQSNFEELIGDLSHVHEVLQDYAAKSVNQFLSLRNWMFGYYIVEYEQNGRDRARYGENLMQAVANNLLHIKGLRFRQLYLCKDFYLTYPHFLRTVSAILQNGDYEEGEILRTVSAESHEGLLSPELLLSRLSFSHFIELIRVKTQRSYGTRTSSNDPVTDKIYTKSFP
ncbi:MAG: DUF1016 N-terminal domain-containing protein [Tannerellaceae bacterium]|jgi:hypothetical protein|nr:DUF1016 N-terminal domain-containing protein [Tannerellaceae bacterium]